MRNCERCGNAMPDTAAICPSCGTISSSTGSGPTPPTDYGQPYSTQGYPPQEPYDRGPQSGQGYANFGYNPPQEPYDRGPQSGQGYANFGYNQQASYGQQTYGTPQPVYPPSVAVNINTINAVAPPSTGTNTAAIVAEVLLSLFLGVYGVGWLIAGKTTTGIVLLICSILLYWPIMIIGSIFTLFLGLICLGPLAIGAVILNAILLSNAIKASRTYMLVTPAQSSQPFPPR